MQKQNATIMISTPQKLHVANIQDNMKYCSWWKGYFEFLRSVGDLEGGEANFLNV